MGNKKKRNKEKGKNKSNKITKNLTIVCSFLNRVFHEQKWQGRISNSAPRYEKKQVVTIVDLQQPANYA